MPPHFQHRKNPPPLSPEGTARLLVAGERQIRYPLGRATLMTDRDQGPNALYLAWELMAFANDASPTQARAAFELLVAVFLALDEGHACLPLDASPSARNFLVERLTATGAAPDDQRQAVDLAAQLIKAVPPELARLFGSPTTGCPLVIEAGRLYVSRVAAAERRLGLSLRARLSGPALPTTDAAIQATLRSLDAAPPVGPDGPMILSSSQRAALDQTLRSPLSIITGGPGTGKTSVVAALLRALVQLSVKTSDIALAAPTGKAAHRMAASLDRILRSIPNPTLSDVPLLRAPPVPTTVHRLLGYHAGTGGFRFHDQRPLPFGVVIVDESSMIDLFLMDALMSALRPGARVVLLGDADQLPAVDAGDVLEALAPHAIRLTASFRMNPARAEGRSLLAVAAKIKQGTGPFPADLLPTTNALDGLRFEGAELLDGGPTVRTEFLARWFDDRIVAAPDFVATRSRIFQSTAGRLDADSAIAARALLRHHDGFRILCVTRGAGRPTGAEAINAYLHDRFRSRFPHQAPDAGPIAGEPVLMQRNDYERGLWNGDPGIVLRVADANGTRRAAPLCATFIRGDDVVAVPLSALGADLAFGFALTVHKSQGSEVDVAALILPDEDLPLLSRQILYTAITRCRQAVVIVGSRAVFEAGVRRDVRRASGLGRRLLSATL